ncbi:hypothetical protein R3P38DRAFT_3067118 [Favolaschia claudopus]|uniref:Uncharacterized protein n=1 Tax=Favolaschia claudopus TaxID=2862362 RepID=A0AAW0A174_9AGAR
MTSAPPFEERINDMARISTYYMFGLVGQTFFFGIYSILIFMSTRMLLQRKLNTKINRIMFGITVSSYMLTLAYWAYSIADGVDRMRMYNILALDPSKALPDHTQVTKWSALFNSLTLNNYVVGDGIVIWRAWIICQDNHRRYIWATIVFFGITAITALFTVVAQIVNFVVSPIKTLPDDNVLTKIINVLQVTTLSTSLLSNLTATAVVAVTARKHWRIIRSAFSEDKANSMRANRILLLLIETGALYCISALIAVCAAFIRMPYGTFGDLYQPVNIEIAGAYPTVVLLLVGTKKSLSESSFANDDFVNSESDPQPLEQIRFASAAQSSTVSRTIRFARSPLDTVTNSSVVEVDISPDSDPSRNPEKGGDLSNARFHVV